MTDYELGYEHGFNDGKPRPGVEKYPLNSNYTAGFDDGDYARCNMPSYMESLSMGSNDHSLDC
jgi:hypothetical protein